MLYDPMGIVATSLLAIMAYAIPTRLLADKARANQVHAWMTVEEWPSITDEQRKFARRQARALLGQEVEPLEPTRGE